MLHAGFAGLFNSHSLFTDAHVCYATDEMPYLDKLQFKTTDVFLKLAVCARQSFVLPQVFGPRFYDERFDVVRGILSITINAPS